MAHSERLELAPNAEPGLLSRASALARTDVARLLWLALQLLVIALAARAFRLENAALYTVVGGASIVRDRRSYQKLPCMGS